ncbi:hypothetical protein TIFTF001_054988 [Ficus carica]|uniref:Uncharacterized protein n=1 Tax=Ficus carica TaxID=3494 RepID=A0AA88JIV1_FICCA|nr:hypothetical protein TIFTF001_054988 [Ficus carica]
MDSATMFDCGAGWAGEGIGSPQIWWQGTVAEILERVGGHLGRVRGSPFSDGQHGGGVGGGGAVSMEMGAMAGSLLRLRRYEIKFLN